MKNDIRTYLSQSSTASSSVDFSDDDSLLEAGIIDSFSMVGLISHLENEYGMKIDEDDMMPENFDSVNAIVAFVQSKQE